MNLFFWTLLNLGVPIVGPVFTLALVAPTHGWRTAKRLIGASVKDGQLFWCAIGLCAAAIYEAVTALERGGGNSGMLAVSVAALCIIAFVSSNVVMNSALIADCSHMRVARRLEPTHDQALPGGTLSRGAVGVSICLTVLAASTFIAIHVKISNL